MANDPKLRLNLVDVYGKPLNETVDVMLTNQVLSGTIKKSIGTGGPVDIAGLNGTPQGLYRIQIDPPSYQFISQFVNMKASGVTPLNITFPVDPKKVRSVNFPLFTSLSADLATLLQNSGNVLGFEGKTGADLYNGFDDIRRAGLLNIAAKCAVTRCTGGSAVIDSIREIRELRGDRFFAVVPKQLREDVKNSVAEGLFHPADSSLHHPPAGFSSAGSFKTPDHYGNLQLTFFMKSEACVVDIDIDDAAGVEHIFQVLGNALSGTPTHPYNIHEILVGFQHIDPQYSFNV